MATSTLFKSIIIKNKKAAEMLEVALSNESFHRPDNTEKALEEGIEVLRKSQSN
jgi:hypothetical protein